MDNKIVELITEVSKVASCNRLSVMSTINCCDLISVTICRVKQDLKANDIDNALEKLDDMTYILNNALQRLDCCDDEDNKIINLANDVYNLMND